MRKRIILLFTVVTFSHPSWGSEDVHVEFTTELPSTDSTTPAGTTDDPTIDAKLVDGGFPLQMESKSLNLDTRLAHLIETKIPPKEEEEQWILENLKNLGPSDKSKCKKILETLPPIAPSPETPWDASDWDRFQVKLEVVYRNHFLEDNEAFLHPAAQAYPGFPAKMDMNSTTSSIPLESDGRYNRLIKLKCFNGSTVTRLNKTGKISCKTFCSTKLYAHPGSVVTLTMLSKSTYHFSVRIGHFNTDTSDLSVWRQYPNMVTIKRFKASEQGEEGFKIHSVFGGIIYIGEIGHSVTQELLKLSISGAISYTQSFTYMKQHLPDWYEIKRFREAPSGDLISPQVTLTYPRSIVKDILDPEELLIHWERIIDAINELLNIPYRESRVHIAFVRELPKGVPLAIGGNPILASESVGAQLTQYQDLWERSGNMYGVMHALTHNFQDHLDFLSFKREDGETFHNEILLNYVKNIVHNVPMEQVRREYGLDDINRTITDFLQDGVSYEEFLYSGIALTWFYDLHRNFGWDSFKKLGKTFKGKMFSSDREKIDSVYVELSRLEGKDLEAYFTSWGLPLSANATGQLKDFPKSNLTILDLLEYCKEGLKPKPKGRGISTKRAGDLDGVKFGEDGELIYGEDSSDVDKDKSLDVESSTKPPTESTDTDLDQPVVKSPKGRAMTAQNYSEYWVPQPGSDYEQITGRATKGLNYKHCFEICITSGNATPILFASKGSLPCFVYFNGISRAIFVGGAHLLTPSDKTAALQADLYMWAGKYAEQTNAFKPLVIKTGQDPKNVSREIVKFFEQSQIPVSYLNASELSEQNFVGVSVVIITEVEDISEQGARLIKKYIESGGGLVAATGGYDTDTIPKYPLKPILAEKFGILFGSDKRYSKNELVFTNNASLYITVEAEVMSAFDYYRKWANTSDVPNSINSAMTSMGHALYLSKGIKLEWKENLKKEFLKLDPLFPTYENEVKSTSSPLFYKTRLKFDEAMMNAFEPEEGYKHPSASVFPGNVPEEMYKPEKFHVSKLYMPFMDDERLLFEEKCLTKSETRKLFTFCKGWCQTGFYAPPGQLIRISFTSPLVESFTVYNSYYVDITSNSVWKRYPVIEFKKRFRKTAVFSDPFGGPILFGDVVAPRNFTETGLEFEITGAAEMAHFFLGQSKVSDWARMKKLDTPFFMFSSDVNEIKFEKRALAVIENPETTILNWDWMWDVFNEFHATPHRSKRTRLIFDSQLTSQSYMMLSGHVKSRAWCSVDAASPTLLRSKNACAKAFLHEWGHNDDLGWWKLGGGGDNTNEINHMYVKNVLHGLPTNTIRMTPEKDYKALEGYIETGLDYEHEFNTQNGHKRKLPRTPASNFYFDIGRLFGWSVYIKLAQLQSKGVNFPSDSFRRDWLLENLSEIVQRDLSDYLLSWGIVTSEKARAKVKEKGYKVCNESMLGLIDMYKKQVKVYNITEQIGKEAGNVLSGKFLPAPYTSKKDPYKGTLEKFKKDGSQIVTAGTLSIKDAASQAVIDIKAEKLSFTEFLASCKENASKELQQFKDKSKALPKTEKEELVKATTTFLSKQITDIENTLQKAKAFLVPLENVKNSVAPAIELVRTKLSESMNTTLNLLKDKEIGQARKMGDSLKAKVEAKLAELAQLMNEPVIARDEAVKVCRPVQGAVEAEKKTKQALAVGNDAVKFLKRRLKEAGKGNSGGVSEDVVLRFQTVVDELEKKAQKELNNYYNKDAMNTVKKAIKDAEKEMTTAGKKAQDEIKKSMKTIK